MNELHHVIYQIVNNPEMLSQAAQHTNALTHNLGLAYDQVQALSAVLQDTSVVKSLLSSETVQALAAGGGKMEPWVPPGAH